MKTMFKYILTVWLLLGILITGFAQDRVKQSEFYKEIPKTRENAVFVNLEVAYGSVTINPGNTENILVADMVVDPSINIKSEIDYRIDNTTGILKLALKPEEKQHRSFGIGAASAGTWALSFHQDVPIDFDIELGAGRGDFDFTDLILNKLNVSTGASRVSLRFDKPNTGFIEHIKIESGVSRFEGIGLANANFRNLSFQGGVGSYSLDFSGELQHEANVTIELGLGAVTVVVPPDVGVKLNARQRWFSSLDVPRDFEQVKRNEYISKNYHDAEGKINITIEAGFGSVRVKR